MPPLPPQPPLPHLAAPPPPPEQHEEAFPPLVANPYLDFLGFHATITRPVRKGKGKTKAKEVNLDFTEPFQPQKLEYTVNLEVGPHAPGLAALDIGLQAFHREANGTQCPCYAIAQDDGAKLIRQDFVPMEAGKAVLRIERPTGETRIELTVMAHNKAKSVTYVVTFHETYGPESAYLSELAAFGQTTAVLDRHSPAPVLLALSPRFKPQTRRYTVDVPEELGHVTLQMMSAHINFKSQMGGTHNPTVHLRYMNFREWLYPVGHLACENWMDPVANPSPDDGDLYDMDVAADVPGAGAGEWGAGRRRRRRKLARRLAGAGGGEAVQGSFAAVLRDAGALAAERGPEGCVVCRYKPQITMPLLVTDTRGATLYLDVYSADKVHKVSYEILIRRRKG